LEILFFILLFLVVVFLAVFLFKKAANPVSAKRPPSHEDPYIVFLQSLSPEERQFVDKVSAYCGKPQINDDDICKYNTHIMSKCFLAMPGWNIWDPSIHEATGQYDRIKRSVDKYISILAYDPSYSIAKIKGTSGIYLTSHERCSCPDYRKRRLPCKHMYALAYELDGNASKCIIDDQHKPLYGLHFALGGFRGSSNNPEGIRAKINQCGGIWSDNIDDDTAALVLGPFASDGKKSFAKKRGIEIFDEETIMNIFNQ